MSRPSPDFDEHDGHRKIEAMVAPIEPPLFIRRFLDAARKDLLAAGRPARILGVGLWPRRHRGVALDVLVAEVARVSAVNAPAERSLIGRVEIYQRFSEGNTYYRSLPQVVAAFEHGGLRCDVGNSSRDKLAFTFPGRPPRWSPPVQSHTELSSALSYGPARPAPAPAPQR